MKNKNKLHKRNNKHNQKKREVRKKQKTPLVKRMVKLLVDNKWRVSFGLFKVLVRWDVYSQKASWLFDVLRTMF